MRMKLAPNQSFPTDSHTSFHIFIVSIITKFTQLLVSQKNRKTHHKMQIDNIFFLTTDVETLVLSNVNRIILTTKHFFKRKTADVFSAHS